MTVAQFRNEALAVPGAIEGSHMGHPDFRVRRKIFATLGYPNPTCAMVKLTPDQQHELIQEAPHVFSPSSGAWGKSGSTKVLLATATKTLVRRAVMLAAKNIDANRPRPAGFSP